MRNLKKVLALVVAVAMLASTGMIASAANYSDVAANAPYADAVNLLSNLGIIKGDDEGLFRPDDTVNRAEAATMIVRMLGLADDVEQGDSQFTDVKADDWFSGYVNVAAANGVIAGMGDGTFNPAGDVTYGQIVKMIVCALGYAPVAEANGGYLGGGYLYAGSSKVTGFTKGVSGTAGAAASRATVARLIYNALEVDLMDQTSFTTGSEGSRYEVLEGKTILSEYLELEKIEGVVVETYLSSAVYEEGDNTVDIVITKNYADEKDTTYEVGDTVTLVAEGTDAATFLGNSVTAFVGENEDGDDAVFSIAAKAGKNTFLTLDTELIEEISDNHIVYYKSEASKTTTKAEIQSVVEIKNNDVEGINNLVVNGFNVDYKLTADLIGAAATGALDEITLLDNDNDGDFEFVFATMPGEKALEFVVTDVDYEEWVLEGEKESFALDFDDDNKLYTIVKDGHVVELESVVADDVVTVLDDEVNVVTVYVSSVVVNGSVDEVDDDVYTISGKEFTLSPISFAADKTLNAGDEGKFYINSSGKIAAVDTVATIANADYVYIIDADVSNGDFGDDEYLVKVVTAAGKVEVLTIKSKKVDVYTQDGVATKLEDSEAFEYVKEYEGIAKIDTTTANEISVIYLPGAKDFVVDNRYESENNKEYNESRATYGTIDLKPGVLAFNVDTKEANEGDLEDAITVSTVSGLFTDGNSYTFVAYGEEDEDPSVIVATDAKTAVDAEAPVMVVTKVSTVTVEDENTTKITGVVAGATVSVIVDPDENLVDVEKGNVILYAKTGDYVTDVEVLLASTEDAPSDKPIGTDEIGTEPSKEMVTIHYGAAGESKSGYFFVDDDKYYFAADCNITVVDYTGANVSIKAGRTTDVKSSTRTTKTLFVKTLSDVEDEVSDIVVFIQD